MIGLSRNNFVYKKGRFHDKPHGSIKKRRQRASFQKEDAQICLSCDVWVVMHLEEAAGGRFCRCLILVHGMCE